MTYYETLPQVAARWGVTRARVHQLVKAGHLSAIRAGRDWLVEGRPEPLPLMRKKSVQDPLRVV